jgi:hypothetical protein
VGPGASGDGQGLWNAQPFPPPPTVDVPSCMLGCARAQPLDKVTRKSHGTGAGCTTVKGFWIPKEPKDMDVSGEGDGGEGQAVDEERCR